MMDGLKIFFILFVKFLHFCSAINVDEVHLSTDTIWIVSSPAHVLCDVSLEEGENVTQVEWYRNNELVYHWFDNGTIMVFDPLTEHVEFPSNMSIWDIKINRVSLDLEGEYVCTAYNAEGASSEGSFQLIAYYSQMSTYSANTEDCLMTVAINMPFVYPRPLVVRCKLYENSTDYEFDLRGFNETKTNSDGSYSYEYRAVTLISDHPKGLYLQCTNLAYGTYIELLTHDPEEPVTCPGIRGTAGNFTFDSEGSNATLIPGCRSDFQVNSVAKFVCQVDQSIKVESVCDEYGRWDPSTTDLTDWPKCTGTVNGVSVMILICIYLIVRIL